MVWVEVSRVMHHSAVVPTQQITRLPFVNVDEFRPGAVREQLQQQGFAFRCVHVLDREGEAGIDVKRLIVSVRECPHHRMRGTGNLRSLIAGDRRSAGVQGFVVLEVAGVGMPPAPASDT